MLEPLLREAVAQGEGRSFQVVLSDNASTDGTRDLLDRFAQQARIVRWVRSSQNLGPDRNYLRAVEAADAEFCWLFGSDDIPVPGAVDRVLNELDRTGADVLLVGRYWCTYDMVPIRRDALFAPDTPTTFDTATADGFAEYLDRASSILALFSYLSSIVVRKSRWDSAGSVEAFVGSAYSHSAKLLAVLAAGAKVAYLPEPLVYCRGENDHFLEHGVFNRYRIDFVGFGHLLDTYVPTEPLNALGRAVLRREYTFPRLLLVVAIATGSECRELQGFLRDYRYPAPIRALVVLAAWGPVHSLLRHVAPPIRRLWWLRQRRRFAASRGSVVSPTTRS